MKLNKSTVAWILAALSTAGGAYVGYQEAGHVWSVAGVSAALMAAATLLGWQANKAPF